MKNLRLLSLGLAVALIFLAATAALAGSSADYAINWQVLTGGGAAASAGNITLAGSLGQTAIGPATAASVATGAGYWYGISVQAPAFPPTYLPIVIK